MKHLNMTYSDIMRMPTGERRFYLAMFEKELQKQKEHYDDIKSKSNSGRGQRTTRISGNELKNKMKNNEIPNA